MTPTYSLEELLPLVASLTEQYTSRESTSISYEKANQLMEAILYCIQEAAEGSDFGQLEALQKVSSALLPEVVYTQGYDIVIHKVQTALHCYNDLIVQFNSYGNQTYFDTVMKGLPAFFQYYDPKFNPQNHILTLDYPVLSSLESFCGIDRIERYLSCIVLEQEFLSRLPDSYIHAVLMRYHADYAELVENICRIVLRNLLGSLFAGKKHSKLGYTKEELAALETTIDILSIGELHERMEQLLHTLILYEYDESSALYRYLSTDLEDFCIDLKNAAKFHCMERQLLL